jgi:hypothetical protein
VRYPDINCREALQAVNCLEGLMDDTENNLEEALVWKAVSSCNELVKYLKEKQNGRRKD